LVDVAIETPATRDAFVNDIRAALSAWRDVPLLPIGTVVVGAVTVVTIPPHDSFAILVLGLAFGFFSFGWFGTQFVWYKRAFDRQPVRPGELFPLTWNFIARYVRLYFAALIPLFILVFIAIRWRTFGFASPGWRIGVLVYVLVFEIAGTFINPTLAFSTRKVTRAVPLGLRMLVQGWPGNWKYVVVPGVTVAALGGVYWFVPSLVRPELEVLSELIPLVFAGAIARYYLRDPLAPSEGGSALTRLAEG
jgi:hypothetical protein